MRALKNLCVLGTVLAAFTGSVAAADLRQGAAITYSNGAADVADFYDSLSGVEASAVPVGLSYRLLLPRDNGFRLDFSAGPVVVTFGDLSYVNVPVSATAGWDFSPAADTSVYLRGGVALHWLDGDYLDDSSAFGGLAVVGVSFARSGVLSYYVEASYDTAAVTFSTWSREQEIKPQGFNLTFGVVF